jgi:hypothetical protein
VGGALGIAVLAAICLPPSNLQPFYTFFQTLTLQTANRPEPALEVVLIQFRRASQTALVRPTS